MKILLPLLMLVSMTQAQFAVSLNEEAAAEAKVVLTPSVVSEIMMIQGLYPHSGIGSFELRDVEFGFDLTILDNLTTSFVLELDGDNGYNIGINTAMLSYSFNEFVSLSGGLLESGFGILDFNALSYPLIYDDLETIQPAIRVDAGNDLVYGSLAMYQGVQTENFLAFTPAIGVTFGDIADIKLSSRIEVEDGGSYTDLAVGFVVAPADFVEIRSEFVSELNQKLVPNEDDSLVAQQALGYFAEAAFFVGDRWTIAARYDERIDDQTVASKSGVRAIEGSATFAVLDPLSLSLGVTGYNLYTPTSDEWKPELKLLASFEMPW